MKDGGVQTAMDLSFERESTRKGSADCGLYLVLPDNWDDPDFFKDLRQAFMAINASPYEKNNHVIQFSGRPIEDHPDFKEKLLTLCRFTQSQGMVFLCEGDFARAKECGADGVIVDTAEKAVEARAVLGEGAIIGVSCGVSRIRAEHAVAAGADFIAFEEAGGGLLNPSIVEWLRLKTDAACLVRGRMTNDDCGFYVAAGADFIDASHYIWNHPEGVMKGVVNMTYAIDLASGREEKADAR